MSTHRHTCPRCGGTVFVDRPSLDGRHLSMLRGLAEGEPLWGGVYDRGNAMDDPELRFLLECGLMEGRPIPYRAGGLRRDPGVRYGGGFYITDKGRAVLAAQSSRTLTHG